MHTPSSLRPLLVGVFACSALYALRYLNSGLPLAVDFYTFYQPSQWMQQGDYLIYPLELVQRFAAGEANLPRFTTFSYPPFVLPLIMWLAYMPFQTAWMVFEALQIGLLTFALGVFVRTHLPENAESLPVQRLAWLLFLPLFAVGCLMGQNIAVPGAFWLLALSYLRTRPLLAGVFIACIACKPQYGMLIAPFLLAGGYWLVIFSAALTLAALIAGSIALYGIGIWEYYLVYAQAYASIIPMLTDINQHMPATLYHELRMMGLGERPAIFFCYAAAAFFVQWIWRLARRDAPLLLIAAVIGVGTYCVNPYGFVYDLSFLVIGSVCMLLHRYHNISAADRISILLASVLPIIATLLRGWEIPVVALTLCYAAARLTYYQRMQKAL